MKCSCDYKGPPFSGVRGQFGLHAHLIPRCLSMDCQLNLHCAKLCMHFLMQTIVLWALNQDFSTNFHLAWGHSKPRQTYMEGKCNCLFLGAGMCETQKCKYQLCCNFRFDTHYMNTDKFLSGKICCMLLPWRDDFTTGELTWWKSFRSVWLKCCQSLMHEQPLQRTTGCAHWGCSAFFS